MCLALNRVQKLTTNCGDGYLQDDEAKCGGLSEIPVGTSADGKGR